LRESLETEGVRSSHYTFQFIRAAKCEKSIISMQNIGGVLIFADRVVANTIVYAIPLIFVLIAGRK
jgi:hypothetical protein